MASAGGAYYRYQSYGNGVSGLFYQELHEPAVMLACSRGFAVATRPVPALQRFLEGEVDRFSCDQLPPDLVTKPATELTARQSRYLMSAVALTWRVFGISWANVAWLAGGLFGAAVAASYAIFRLGMSRTLAVLGAAVFAILPGHLRLLHDLRDYAIAPFMLAAFALIGLLVRRPSTPRRLMALAVAFGAVAGIGYGFRPDISIVAPLFAFALFGFMPGALRDGLRWKLASAGAALLVFVALSFPVLMPNLREGSCLSQVVVEGFGTDFTKELGLVEAPYNWGRNYNDLLAFEHSSAYLHRRSPGSAPIPYCSNADDAAGLSYVLAIARTFPADMLTRAYASVLGIVGLPFLPQNWLIWRWTGAYVNTGLFFVAAAILFAAWAELRLGIFLAIFLLYTGGYPVVQFSPRHHFYLSFITLWAVGFVLYHGALFVRHARDSAPDTSRLVPVAAFAAVVLVVLWSPLLLLRPYQERRASALLQSYFHFEWRALEPADLPLPDDGVLGDGQPVMLIAADARTHQCDEPVSVTFTYGGHDPNVLAFAKTVRLSTGGREATRVVSSVFRGFQGVTFEPEGCAGPVYRILAESQPLWVNAVLPPDWQQGPFYQQLENVWLLHKPPPNLADAWSLRR